MKQRREGCARSRQRPNAGAGATRRGGGSVSQRGACAGPDDEVVVVEEEVGDSAGPRVGRQQAGLVADFETRWPFSLANKSPQNSAILQRASTRLLARVGLPRAPAVRTKVLQ